MKRVSIANIIAPRQLLGATVTKPVESAGNFHNRRKPGDRAACGPATRSFVPRCSRLVTMKYDAFKKP